MGHDRDITLFIDPVSHHFQGDALFDSNKAHLNGNNILAPYVYLRDWFVSRGIRVHTADYLLRGEKRSARNIYISMGLLNNYRALSKRPDVILSAFFALECPIVEPTLYQALTQVQRYFKRIFSFSTRESLQPFIQGTIHCQPFVIPQSYHSVHEEFWQREDRRFMVMINANKLPRLYWQELYTERLKAVEFFSRTNDIDLYGVGWDKPSNRVGKTWIPATVRRFQSNLLQQWQRFFPDPLLTAARRVYRGPAKSKAEILGDYTFALCFENSILQGWITEKIFDCFFTGTIPIYWGAPDIEAHIPVDCFIDMRNFANYQELYDYLKSLSAEEIRRYKQNAREYLKSPHFSPFSKDAFVELFCRIVQEDMGIQIL
jgi:hypothetical protein